MEKGQTFLRPGWLSLILVTLPLASCQWGPSVQSSQPCRRTAVPFHPERFLLFDLDMTLKVQYCPPGQVFNQGLCLCEYSAQAWTTPPTTTPPPPPTTTLGPADLLRQMLVGGYSNFLRQTLQRRNPLLSKFSRPRHVQITTTRKPTTPPPPTTVRRIPTASLVHYIWRPPTQGASRTSPVQGPPAGGISANTSATTGGAADLPHAEIQRICRSQRLDGDMVYAEHPSACDKYVVCFLSGMRGERRGEVKECPFGEFWDQKVRTCRYSLETSCKNDPCWKNSQLTTYEHPGNCRGYWRCLDGYSVSHCCARGQRFRQGQGCVHDPFCRSQCLFGDSVGEQTCDKKAVPGFPGKFQQRVSPKIFLTMECAPGALFDGATCRCSFLHKAPPTLAPSKLKLPEKVCKSELELDFTKDLIDLSGKKVLVQNNNVSLKNGMACFHGNDSLVVHRFSNADIGKDLTIKLRYILPYADLGKGAASQALLSNGGNGIPPTVVISTTTGRSFFGLRSMNSRYLGIHVPLTHKVGQWQDAAYSLHNDVMTVTINGKTRSRTVNGMILRSDASLKIGVGKNFEGFKGCIDHLSISFCPVQ